MGHFVSNVVHMDDAIRVRKEAVMDAERERWLDEGFSDSESELEEILAWDQQYEEMQTVLLEDDRESDPS